MITITRKYHFYAAHRNREAGEKCARVHGHTYNVEVALMFRATKANGVTMLFSDIDSLVDPIIRAFDHRFLLWREDPLCELFTLADEEYLETSFQTSAENLAIFFFVSIKAVLPAVAFVTVQETESSIVKYDGTNVESE